MSSYRFWFTFVVFCLLVSSLDSQETSQRLRLTRADVLRRDTTTGGHVRQVLQGNVEFRQGEAKIQCDLATYFPELSEAHLIGSVQIYDTEGTLFADTVYIYQKQNKQIAVGNVISISKGDSTFADRMTNWEKEDRVLARGNVKVVRSTDNTVIKSGYLEYFRDQEVGLILDSPELTQFDSLGLVTMHITADTMQTLIGDDKTIAWGNVSITQKKAQATCGRSINIQNENRVELYDTPRITQDGRTISGDTLFLHLDKSKLQTVEVRGNAVATIDADTLNPGRWVNKLSGNRMAFHFADEKLQKVYIEEQAVSLYHIIKAERYEGVSETTGDRIEIQFIDEEADKVFVQSKPGFATGKLTPPF